MDFNTKIKIGQHALERFIEHFPQFAKEIGFNSKWENNNKDDDKQYNMFLLFELFKRSKEQKSILNDMAYMISMCERNDVDISDFQMFSNNGVIFVCAENREHNTITIRTVMPVDYNLGRFIPEKDRKELLLDDKNQYYKIGIMDEQDYNRQALKMLQLPYQHMFHCERIEKAAHNYNEYIQTENYNEDEELREAMMRGHNKKQEQKLINDIKEEIQDRLSEYGMEYVMTLSSGKAICFLNDEYDYNNENKNTLKVIPQKAIRMLLEQNKEKLSFIDNETFEKCLKMENLSREHYIGLLSQIIKTPDNHFGKNDTFLRNSYLKDILRITIPEELKQELEINNKDIKNSNVDKIVMSDYLALNNFLFMIKNHKQDVINLFKFDETRNTESFLSKNKLTGEYSLNVFRKGGSSYSLRLTMEENLDLLHKFVDKLGNDVEPELFEFVHHQIKKYHVLNDKFKQLIDKIENKEAARLENNETIDVLLPEKDETITVKKYRNFLIRN